MTRVDTVTIQVPANPVAVTGATVPVAVALSGSQAKFAWDEFFAGHIRNKHTRQAYLRAVRHFLDWVHPIEADLARITPGMVGNYFDELPLSVPSKKLHMAAIRGFFDVLVNRHVCMLNPSHSVKTERYSVMEGKTPEITPQQARALLDSIETSTLIGRRDKAIIATLVFTAARAGAVAKLRIRDLQFDGTQYHLRFSEKGGKQRQIPVRHDLQQWLLEHLADRASAAHKDAFIFCTMVSGKASDRPISGVDVCRIVKRRLLAANLPISISPHSFRSCAATSLLSQGTPLEDVQYLLGHSDARVTRLYDRRQRQVTRNIVERIGV